eukprot:37579_1
MALSYSKCNKMNKNTQHKKLLLSAAPHDAYPSIQTVIYPNFAQNTSIFHSDISQNISYRIKTVLPIHLSYVKRINIHNIMFNDRFIVLLQSCLINQTQMRSLHGVRPPVYPQTTHVS